jgi:hypothetical protein
MQIHMDTSNIAYYLSLILYIQYEDSTTLILAITYSICIKNHCLNKLAAFYVILDSMLSKTLCKFIWTLLILSIIYFFQLNIQYEYSMTLILHKTSSGCIKNCCVKQVVCILCCFGLITAHKFVQIHMNTRNTVY